MMSQTTDILDRIADLHKQATTERSHYYTASTLEACSQEIKQLRDALIPFARIWAFSAQLEPDPSRSVRDFVAGVWPNMADAKRAHDLVWSYRKPGQ